MDSRTKHVRFTRANGTITADEFDVYEASGSQRVPPQLHDDGTARVSSVRALTGDACFDRDWTLTQDQLLDEINLGYLRVRPGAERLTKKWLQREFAAQRPIVLHVHRVGRYFTLTSPTSAQWYGEQVAQRPDAPVIRDDRGRFR